MPIYQLECNQCENTFESICKVGDDYPPCEKCGGSTSRTITAPGGYHIKGDNSASRRPKSAGAFKKAAK